ncbi:MAG: aldehyde dehydrogenase family protein, partial [Conexivisphaera sp.]
MRRAAVGGDWVDGGATAPVVDPSTGEQFEEVAFDPRGDLVRAAVDAAEEGAERLSGMPLSERGAVLLRAAGALESRLEEVASLLARESGKPIRDARVEVRRAVSLIRAAAEEARTVLEGSVYRVDGYDYPPGNEGRMVLGVREPIGVVGAI